MFYCLWTTVCVFVSTVSEIKVYIYIDELSVVDGVLLKGQRVVVPDSFL